MKIFQCLVVDKKGQKHNLERKGPSADWIVRDLNQEGFLILKVLESDNASRINVKKLPLKVIIDFTQTLALLMGNGLTLKEALEVATNVFSNSLNQKVFIEVSQKVQKGESLYQSLLYWKSSFPSLYLGLIKIGEKTGDLSSVLNRLSSYLLIQKTLKNKTSNAMTYPLLVLSVAIIGLSLLMIFVFPTFTNIISSINKNASLIYETNLRNFQIISFSTFMLFIILCFSFLFIFQRCRVDRNFRTSIDQIILKIPFINNYSLSKFAMNFSFAFETLLAAGYPVEEALKESSIVISNLFLQDKILLIREEVIKGKSLSIAFKEQKIFPDTFIGWIGVGEGSHDLLKCFTQLRIYYQQEQEQFHTKFMNLIEPSLIIFVGGIMLVLILNFITPIFSMLGNLI